MAGRLLTEAEAREYLGGCNPRSVLQPVRVGYRPRWDRVALDRRLDELSGLERHIPHAPEVAEDTAEAAVAQWRQSRNGAASGRS